jgi:hypothetical protein
MRKARAKQRLRRRLEMTKASMLISGAAAVALTLGVNGEGNVPKQLQTPLWNGDLVIVKDESTSAIGQPDKTAKQSAEMGKADGVQGGDQGNTPKSQSAMMKGAQTGGQNE